MTPVNLPTRHVIIYLTSALKTLKREQAKATAKYGKLHQMTFLHDEEVKNLENALAQVEQLLTETPTPTKK